MQSSFGVSSMALGILTKFAQKIGEQVYKKVSQKYNDSVNKDKIDYGEAFETYLVKTRDYVGKAKTILYGQTPYDIYSFFECMNLKTGREIIDTSNVNNVLQIGNRLIITGTGGIGKSMLMRHFFLNAIENTERIPVLVELRGLNEKSISEISLEDYVYDFLKNFGFRLERKYFQYSLETGCYFFLFDGYDEVKNAFSQKVSNEIIDFSNRYSDNYLVVSSRPLEEFVGWSNFTECSAMPLNKRQALSLISKLDYDDELKNKFYAQLDKELFEKYRSFASNPLLLTIMLMTFESRVAIPDSRADFYEQAFSTLFHRHDAMKKGRFKREIASKLRYEDFRKMFSYFCFRSFFKNQYEFTETTVLENISKAKEKVCQSEMFDTRSYLNDLTKAVCVLIHEGFNFKFTHRSFQEYFAVLYTIQLSDDEQKQFITSWLKSIDGRLTTDFLGILFDLQPERFMKNMLYDAMYELINMYEAHGSSDKWLIEYLYDSIILFERNEDEIEQTIWFTIKESYYLTVFDYMRRYLIYIQGNVPSADHCMDCSGIINALNQRYPSFKVGGISIKEIITNGLYELVEPLFHRFLEDKKWIFASMDKINVNTFGNRKKFESMVESL